LQLKKCLTALETGGKTAGVTGAARPLPENPEPRRRCLSAAIYTLAGALQNVDGRRDASMPCAVKV
jgi:hypothetical protein